MGKETAQVRPTAVKANSLQYVESHTTIRLSGWQHEVGIRLMIDGKQQDILNISLPFGGAAAGERGEVRFTLSCREASPQRTRVPWSSPFGREDCAGKCWNGRGRNDPITSGAQRGSEPAPGTS